MNRKQAQIFEGISSVVINLGLFGVKFGAGLITGSIALMADAWHTLSDSLTSIFVIVAAPLAAKKPDKEHPFGHGRWEMIASIFMAGVLAVIGYEFLASSVEKFQNKEGTTFGTLAIVVTVVGIIIKEALAQLGFYLGRKYNNPVLTADGWHSRTDALSSVIVLIGIIVTKFAGNLWWMDSVLGGICALTIFYAAFEILKEVITKILGEEPEQEFIDELTTEIKRIYNNDLKLHHIHLHNYVTYKELTFHIALDKNMTIEEGYNIIKVIEDMIEEKFNIAATIRVEPLQDNK